jgi:3-deoxy-alpha-D-manno-octulosonate 8-oxidase
MYYKVTKNISHYIFGNGAINQLKERLKLFEGYGVYIIDDFFRGSSIESKLPFRNGDVVKFISTKNEPTTNGIDELMVDLRNFSNEKPSFIIGIGGGSTLDTAKAISNLFNNSGRAEDYQGWDLVKNPGIFKIGIPTISGTGAEASRTCVMTNYEKKLKLGMNSDFTIYDELILDPDLTSSVNIDQYFYTGMDSYIHCIESLDGSHRHPIGDSFSREALNLCREVFLSENMKADEHRSRLMIASYLGGVAIANSFVGVIHPFSAGLSIVLGTHHCMANCITMNAMEEFYPKEFNEFFLMVEKQKVNIPKGVCANLTDEQYLQLYKSTVIHEKPLINALGENFKDILTLEKVTEIFKKM